MPEIRPGVDDDAAAVEADWLSAEATIDPETGERSDRFDTITPRKPAAQ